METKLVDTNLKVYIIRSIRDTQLTDRSPAKIVAPKPHKKRVSTKTIPGNMIKCFINDVFNNFLVAKPKENIE